MHAVVVVLHEQADGPFSAELFLAADADSSGYLDRQEFAHVLKSANLHLNER